MKVSKLFLALTIVLSSTAAHANGLSETEDQSHLNLQPTPLALNKDEDKDEDEDKNKSQQIEKKVIFIGAEESRAHFSEIDRKKNELEKLQIELNTIETDYEIKKIKKQIEDMGNEKKKTEPKIDDLKKEPLKIEEENKVIKPKEPIVAKNKTVNKNKLSDKYFVIRIQNIGGVKKVIILSESNYEIKTVGDEVGESYFITDINMDSIVVKKGKDSQTLKLTTKNGAISKLNTEKEQIDNKKMAIPLDLGNGMQSITPEMFGMPPVGSN